MRVPALALVLLSLLPFSVQAQMLTIEWRWVDSTLSGAALAAVRDGSTVIGTAGSVSPRSGGTVTSTRSPEDSVGPVERLSVLNGHQASVSMNSQQPVQWLDLRVGASTRKARAATQTQLVDRVRSFTVTPQWPGGSAPVQVTIKVLTPQADAQGGGQGEMSTTASVPLNTWHAVARSGDTARALPKGTYGTAEAAVVQQRDLQLRVSVEP
jgi:hypothetical protein